MEKTVITKIRSLIPRIRELTVTNGIVLHQESSEGSVAKWNPEEWLVWKGKISHTQRAIMAPQPWLLTKESFICSEKMRCTAKLEQVDDATICLALGPLFLSYQNGTKLWATEIFWHLLEQHCTGFGTVPTMVPRTILEYLGSSTETVAFQVYEILKINHEFLQFFWLGSKI